MSPVRLPPVFFFALAFASGILLADSERLPLSWSLGASLIVSAFLLVNAWRSFRAGAYLPYFLFFVLGIFLTSVAGESLEAGPLYRLAQAGKGATVIGVVVKEPVANQFGDSFELLVEEIETEGRSFHTSEEARVTCRSSDGRVAAGNRIAVRGFLSPPGGKDPGWRTYYFHQGVAAEVSTSSDRMKILEGKANSLYWFSGRVRANLKRSVNSTLGPSSAGLLIGVILGDTGGVDDATQQDFRATGLTHALAVSGLNIMFLIGALWPFLRLARASPMVQIVSLSVSVWMYALLAQGSPSVMRASVMAQFLLVAWWSGRRRDATAAISAAALLLLFMHPFLIFDIGFQLSFAATYALVWFSPIIAEKFSGLPRFLSSAVSACLAAQLGVLPLLAYYFGQLSVLALPANLVVIPASDPALIFGIVGGLLDYISPSLASIAIRLAGFFIDVMKVSAAFFASLPASSIAVQSPGLLEIVVIYAFLFVGVFLFARWKGRFNLSHLAVLLLLPTIAAVSWQGASAKPPKAVEVCFLNVGQGDAVLIRDAEGTTALIDAGPDERVIAASLAAKGVNKVDLLFVSHQHADHVGGLPAVFRSSKVGRLVMPAVVTKPGLKRLADTARSRGTKIENAKSGREYRVGMLIFKVVGVGEPGEGENNASTIVRFNHGDLSVMLPGDAEVEEESSIAKNAGLRSSILKVPHHGGASSADPNFLRAVAPRVAVISVGQGNSYGMPTRTALSRLKALGARIFRTDQDGDVTIASDGKGGIRVETSE